MSPTRLPDPVAPPALRVVRGTPTDVELAAVVAVLGAVAAAVPPARPARSRWAAPARGMRPFGPVAWDSWRTSARPR